MPEPKKKKAWELFSPGDEVILTADWKYKGYERTDEPLAGARGVIESHVSFQDWAVPVQFEDYSGGIWTNVDVLKLANEPVTDEELAEVMKSLGVSDD